MADNWKLLTAEETTEGGGVLTRAFYDDPLQKWLLPEPDERMNNAPGAFQSLLMHGVLFGEVLTPASGVTGTAIWNKPGHWEMTEESMAKAGVDRMAEYIGEEAFMRFIHFFGYIEQYHHRDAPMDHWYLAIFGVDPPLQGKGIGSTLVRPILKRADESGLPCYVETAQPKNVPLYEHLGFKLKVDEVEPRSGVRFWTMLREPNG